MTTYKNYSIKTHDALMGWYAEITDPATGEKFTTDLYRAEQRQAIEDAQKFIDTLTGQNDRGSDKGGRQ